jgi:hypothetical protein
MAKRLTPQQRKFKAASNACIRKGPRSWSQFGRCMKSKLGGRRKTKRRKRRR